MQGNPSGAAASRKWVRVKRHPGIYRVGSRYVITWRDRAGKRRSQSFRTLAEAVREKGRRNAGEIDQTSRQRFDMYARAWIERYEGRKGGRITEGTRDTYRDALERFAIPHFGRMKLGEVRPPDVKALVRSMQDSGLHTTTVRRYLAPLGAMFSEAVEEGTLATNPMRDVRVVTRERRPAKPRMLTPDEVRRIREHVPQEHRDLYDFLALTGCRIAEALGATWQRIAQDVDGRPVFIVREQADGSERRATTKTAAGERAIPLSPDMARRLTKRRAEATFAADTDPIFPTLSGTPISAHNFRTRVWRPAREAAGLTWATPHTLRHSLASLLLEHGLTIEQVAAWLGHTDSSFTLKTYIHTRDTGSADFLDGVLFGAS